MYELSEIATWVTIIGLPITIVIIFLGYRQYKYTRKIEEAKMWIELRNIFTKYDFVNQNLRPGGVWYNGNSIPDDVKIWSSIDEYLGEFELCKHMMDRGLINKNIFKNQYYYRINNIIANQEIINKIKSETQYWIIFMTLCKDFGFNIFDEVLDNLKITNKGLMKKLLTGEVRVKV